MRAGLDAVLKALKEALLDAPHNPAWAEGKNWVPGDEEWSRCFRSVTYVDHEAQEGRAGGLVVTITSDDPRATRDGLVKYRPRVERAMTRWFGYVFSLQVRADAEAAA